MPGYEPCRFLQTLTPKDLLCSVCTYVMKTPVICSKCKVLACQDCSKKTYFSYFFSLKPPFFPFKNLFFPIFSLKTPYFPLKTFKYIKSGITCEHVFSVNAVLKSKIDALSIKCKYWTKGCMEILKIGALQGHEDSQCYYSHYQCARKECEEISLPGRIKHMPECGFFMITCETCKKELKQSDVLIKNRFFTKKTNFSCFFH